MYKGKSTQLSSQFVCLSGCWFLLDPVSAVYVMIDSDTPGAHSTSLVIITRTALVLFPVQRVWFCVLFGVIINLHDNVEAQPNNYSILYGIVGIPFYDSFYVRSMTCSDCVYFFPLSIAFGKENAYRVGLNAINYYFY